MTYLMSRLLSTVASVAALAVLAAPAPALSAEGDSSKQIESLLEGGDPDPDAPLTALGEPPIPADNPQTPEKIELGKKLFFDPRLGGAPTTPCSACHLPDVGWDVEDKVSFGYPGTVHWRNSQTIVNSAYYGKLFWAGSSKSLESQAKSAAGGAVAGNGEADMMEARLAFIPEYREAFNKVFGDEWPRIGNAWKAIAAFERTIVQTDTPFDAFLRGDDGALDDSQKRGLELFRSKAGCIECHNGALLSDEKYYNTGVPPLDEWDEDGLKQVTFRYELYAKGSTEDMYRHTKDDPGFYFRSKEISDKGKFRTPSLRYTLYTEPYMHNGMLETLEDVVEFYNQGGGTNDFADNKTALIKPLGLNDQEKTDLVNFIKSLSGEEILVEEPDLPDYAPLPDVVETKEAK